MRLTRWSGFITSLVTLTLLLGIFVTSADVTRAQASAEVGVVPPSIVHQEEYTLDVVVNGFAPNEPVSIWQTLPDFTVIDRGGHGTNSRGTARVTMEMDASYPVGRHYFSVRGENSGAYVIAECDILPPPVQVDSGVTIQAMEGSGLGGQQLGYFSFKGQGYMGKETISLWLTYPDGSVIDQGLVRSDHGSWDVSIEFDETDQVGQYYLTGYGNTSGRTGVATFFVRAGFNVDVAGGAMLEVSHTERRQLEGMELRGSGFAPGETISIWLTESDGSVWYITELVSANGSFALPGALVAQIRATHAPTPGSPIGPSTFTAYGQSSKLIATATVQLWAGTTLGN